MPDDADAIAAVHVASWQAAYAGVLPDHVLAALSVAERATRWRTRLVAPSPSTTLVAADHDDVLGFASVGPSRDPDAPSPDTGQLHAIYVDPTRWQAGIGRALFARARDLASAHGHHVLTLWVVADNARARRFYERMAMHADGAQKREVLEGILLDAVRYRLSL
jgi:GNAT superfamily N-acetyltransferase